MKYVLFAIPIITLALLIFYNPFNFGTNREVPEGADQTMDEQSQLPESRLQNQDEFPVESRESIEEFSTQTLAESNVEESDQVRTGDRVTVNYRGWLASNGEIFDQSFGREPFSFNIGEGMVIQGWEQGVLGMEIGEVRRLYIPAELGYGEVGQGSIPPNSNLIFDVELLAIN